MEKFPDEIDINMVSALGVSYGTMKMPKKMEQGLIKAYLESGAVRSSYLYIDGKEITDGIDHNPLHQVKK